MATPTLSHAMALPYIANNDAPDDPNVFTLGEIATVLADSAAVSSITSQVTSTAASGALDSAPVSTADSKAASAATRASVADSKALSVSTVVGVADSKALSVSVNTSIADSKAESVADTVVVENLPNYPLAGGEVGVSDRTYPWGDARRYGAVGDYNPEANDGTDDTTALANAFSSADEIILEPHKKYRITDTLDISNKTIVANGAEIWRSDTATDYALEATGTIGGYHNLDSNADAGQNVVVCAALAASLERGHLVKVTSGATFLASGGDGLYQGEMAIVRTVDGANIYLDTPLFDSYTTAAVAKIGLVTPTTVRTIGRLVVGRHPSALASQAYGLRATYALNADLDIDAHDCTAKCVTLRSCYAPRVRLAAQNAYYTGSGLSYGVSLEDSTTYPVVQVSARAVRHAVACGGAPANNGVVWGAKIHDSVGSGLGSAAIFDAHEESGSVEYDNCTAIGGSMSDGAGNTLAPVGFGVASRYAAVNNCRAIRCAGGVTTRDDADMYELRINGLHAQDCTSHAVTLHTGTRVRKLWVSGVTGSVPSGSAGTSFYGVSVSPTTGQVDEWHMDGIRMSVGGILNVSGTGVVPATLMLGDSSCDDSSTPDSTLVTGWRGVTISNDNVTAAILNNVKIHKKGMGMRVTSSLTRLVLSNPDFADNNQHIWVDEATITHAKVHGGRFVSSKNAQATFGVLRNVDGNAMTTVDLSGVYVDTDECFAGGHASASVAVIIHGPCDLPSPFAIGRVLASGWLEYVGGSPNQARLIRGDGSPNTVVTAPKACIFERADGSAATLLYVNTDGATAWTAFA